MTLWEKVVKIPWISEWCQEVTQRMLAVGVAAEIVDIRAMVHLQILRPMLLWESPAFAAAILLRAVRIHRDFRQFLIPRQLVDLRKHRSDLILHILKPQKLSTYFVFSTSYLLDILASRVGTRRSIWLHELFCA